MFKKSASFIRSNAAKSAAGFGALVTAGMQSAQAALDTAAVDTAITSAVGTGTTVGGYVIAAVATLVVVGLVIGIVKKL